VQLFCESEAPELDETNRSEEEHPGKKLSILLPSLSENRGWGDVEQQRLTY
jgi:hypothetical protein